MSVSGIDWVYARRFPCREIDGKNPFSPTFSRIGRREPDNAILHNDDEAPDKEEKITSFPSDVQEIPAIGRLSLVSRRGSR
jgi:hypothetical protein